MEMSDIIFNIFLGILRTNIRIPKNTCQNLFLSSAFEKHFFFLQYEAKTHLERFAGSTSISSADLFDDPKKQTGKRLITAFKKN